MPLSVIQRLSAGLFVIALLLILIGSLFSLAIKKLNRISTAVMKE